MIAAQMGTIPSFEASYPHHAAVQGAKRLAAMGVTALASTALSAWGWAEPNRASPPPTSLARTFQGLPSSSVADGHSLRSPTASVDEGMLLAAPAKAANPAINELLAFRVLAAGWDGERALAPRREAIDDAIRFLHAAGESASGLEPTLHVDGSVILEIGDGADGSFTFRGDRRIICAVKGMTPQAVAFEGRAIPSEVRAALIG